MKPDQPVEHRPKRFIDRMSVYGLEFAVAMITLVITVSVLSFAVFALCSYMTGNEDVSLGRGYFALWTSASAIVWAPVALLFYLRSRAYMAAHPEINSNAVQRTFVIIYQVLMILTIISFAVAAVYATLMSFVQAGDVKEVLLGVALPSAISALLYGGALVAFFKRPVVSRRTFAAVFTIGTLLILVPVIILSISSLRSLNADNYKTDDLQDIKSAIDQYSRANNSSTPRNLDDVNQYLNSKTKERLDEYTYKRVDNTRFELCTDFAAASRYANSSRYSSSYYDSYSTYANFGQHDKGNECFKLRASSYYYGLDDTKN